MLKTQLLIGFVMIVMAQAIDPIRLEHEWASFKVSFYFPIENVHLQILFDPFFHIFFSNALIRIEKL